MQMNGQMLFRWAMGAQVTLLSYIQYFVNPLKEYLILRLFNSNFCHKIASQSSSSDSGSTTSGQFLKNLKFEFWDLPCQRDLESVAIIVADLQLSRLYSTLSYAGFYIC